MGVRDIVPALSGGQLGRSADVHYECRNCGENLHPDTDACPTCGGCVATYTFE
jgi:rRNA maturation endonuclease Nob1